MLPASLQGPPEQFGTYVQEWQAHWTRAVENFIDFAHPAYERKVFGRPRHKWTTGEILALTPRPICAPGRCYRYSNTNYVIAAAIVERVAGMPFMAFLQERIFGHLATVPAMSALLTIRACPERLDKQAVSALRIARRRG